MARRVAASVKYPLAFLFLLLAVAGLYLMFLYEVPDGQEVTNTWVSSFLIVLGAVGCIAALLWKGRRDPFASQRVP